MHTSSITEQKQNYSTTEPPRKGNFSVSGSCCSHQSESCRSWKLSFGAIFQTLLWPETSETYLGGRMALLSDYKEGTLCFCRASEEIYCTKIMSTDSEISIFRRDSTVSRPRPKNRKPEPISPDRFKFAFPENL